MNFPLCSPLVWLTYASFVKDSSIVLPRQDAESALLSTATNERQGQLSHSREPETSSPDYSRLHEVGVREVNTPIPMHTYYLKTEKLHKQLSLSPSEQTHTHDLLTSASPTVLPR